MKKTYVKPVATKSKVTLQRVTALAPVSMQNGAQFQ